MRNPTVLSLKVSITRSPPSRDANAISTIKMGFDLTIRQLTISPPTGVMALSMSAAVVPGAKFCAMTVNGPARPRMVIPMGLPLLAAPAAPLGLMMLTCCGASVDVSMRSRAADRRAARRPALLPAAPGAVMRELREPRSSPLMEWCRSCVHSPLTLPGGAGFGRIPIDELRCYNTEMGFNTDPCGRAMGRRRRGRWVRMCVPS